MAHTPASTPTSPPPSLLDRLASAIQRRHEPGSFFGKALRLLSRLHLALQLGCVAGVAGLLAGMALIGERNLLTAFCLYLPAYLWLAPFLLLFPLALLTPQRWVCLLQLALAGYLLWPYMGWRPLHPAHGPLGGKPYLTLMSNNRGQKGDESMSGFISAQDPHVMLFQEAGRRAENYLKGYPQFSQARSDSEFTLVSKLPILESTSLRLDQDDRGEGGQITASRTVLDYRGARIAIYNVHMPTPRNALKSLRGPALLHGVISLPGTPWRAGRDDHMRYWDRKVRLTEELRGVIEKEKLPFLVAGDFNMPHQGYLYGYFAKTAGGLTDCHAVAGSGYGYTFPGVSRNPLSPWLRLDYIFASRHWSVQKCVTERDRPSQHRAVVAVLTLDQEPK